MRTEHFYRGDPVLYIPTHAHGDEDHKSCERGVVSSKNNAFVFVKFDNAVCKMETGDEPYTAQACDPKNLKHR